MLTQATLLLNPFESGTRFVSTIRDKRSKEELSAEVDLLKSQLEALNSKLQEQETTIQALRREIQGVGKSRRRR